MGLDMYLYGVNYYHGYKSDENEKKKYEQIKELLEEKETDGIEVHIEILYWRKANAIHKWFVDNCQEGVDDCKKYYVESYDLERLKDICKRVLETGNTDELQTQSGFFFGGTDYDDYYVEEVSRTYDELCKILKEDKYEYYMYQSSW